MEGWRDGAVCMLAPVLNYSKELKCLIHVSRLGRRPVTKAKTEETFTQSPPPFIRARAAQTRYYFEQQTGRKNPASLALVPTQMLVRLKQEV